MRTLFIKETPERLDAWSEGSVLNTSACGRTDGSRGREFPQGDSVAGEPEALVPYSILLLNW